MKRLFEPLAAMPRILRLIVLASFFTGTAVLIATVFRVGTFRIYDETLSGEQLWSEGYGPFFVIIALIMIAAGVGILKGRRWARWLVLLIYVAASPVLFIYSRHHPSQNGYLLWIFVVPAFLWAAFFYWYLFHKQKDFFAQAL
jgi:hypothetical protein